MNAGEETMCWTPSPAQCAAEQWVFHMFVHPGQGFPDDILQLPIYLYSSIPSIRSSFPAIQWYCTILVGGLQKRIQIRVSKKLGVTDV
jgi:hypothetical protein